MHKRKILHVIDNLGTGGAEILLVNTIKDLPGYEHVVILLNGPEELKNDLPTNITYHKLNFDLSKRVLCKAIQFPNIYQLRKIILKEKPDIIHAHLFWSVFYSRFAWDKKSKFFYTIHSMMGDRVFKDSFIYRWLEKLTISKSQNLVAISESVLKNYLDYIPFKGSTSIVYNYIPDQYFKHKKLSYKKSSNIFKIISVGNIKPVKNYEVQIRAMALLSNNFQLDIFGSGDSEQKRLLGLMEELNISNVRFMGSASKMYEILPTYDLFVMSSLSEGYSIARAEAMAAALPVLLSNISSFQESTDGQAIFFNPSNPAELAKKIKEISLSCEVRQELGFKNNMIALKYGRKADYLKKLENLYN
jgi:glycosyltransferase involved in cell wall biosynthesis